MREMNWAVPDRMREGQEVRAQRARAGSQLVILYLLQKALNKCNDNQADGLPLGLSENL